MREKYKSFFINLRNPEEILKMKNDFLILFIKEDIINSVIKKTFVNNIILEKIMKNKYFMKKIFRKKTKININGKYYSLRKYCKLTNNKELKRLLLKYNFVKMVKKINRRN